MNKNYYLIVMVHIINGKQKPTEFLGNQNSRTTTNTAQPLLHFNAICTRTAVLTALLQGDYLPKVYSLWHISPRAACYLNKYLCRTYKHTHTPAGNASQVLSTLFIQLTASLQQQEKNSTSTSSGNNNNNVKSS